jgi:hypothetical protein
MRRKRKIEQAPRRSGGGRTEKRVKIGQPEGRNIPKNFDRHLKINETTKVEIS